MHKRDYTGVVLDEPQAQAILYYAIKENMISIDTAEDRTKDMPGHSFIKRILAKPPTAESKDIAFEQMVIGGKVYLPFSIPDTIRGDILEREIVVQVPKTEKDDLLNVIEIAPSVLTSMLRMRGIPFTEEQIDDNVNDFKKEYSEFLDISNGIEEIDAWYELHVKIMELLNIEDNKIPKPVMEKWQSVKKVYEKVRPIIDARVMYSNIIKYSLNLNALSSLPLCSSSSNRIDFRLAQDTGDRVYLMKVASEELDSTPIGISLKQTIKKAGTPEAEVYRVKLDEWANAIRTQDSKSYDKAFKDIKKAQEGLKRAKDWERRGKFATVMGVTSLAIPPISSSASIMGGVSLAGELKNKMQNKWAMFGKS